MKKCILTMFIFYANYCAAQSAASDQVASSIAQRMQDSLQLTNAQKASVYSINQSLSMQKQSVRQAYTSMDSLRIKFQRIESTRDSLYGTVLDQGQFAQYMQKKKNLVSARRQD